MLDEAGEKLIKEYSKEENRYLKTPEHFVRFPVYERRIRVSGFPDVEGFGPGRRGRVLYRDRSQFESGQGQHTFPIVDVKHTVVKHLRAKQRKAAVIRNDL